MKMIYLAGAIDAADKATAAEWRKTAKDFFAAQGIASFDPQGAFRMGLRAEEGDRVDGVQSINNAAIDQSDAVLVELYHHVPHVGTLMEVGHAIATGKPVFAWIGDQYASHVSLRHPSVRRYKTLQTAMTDAAAYLLHAPEVPKAEGGVLECLLDLDACNPDAKLEPYELQKLFPLPTRAYTGDAGFDLPCARKTVIQPGTFCDVPLAFRIAPPPGYWYRIIGRSSTLRKLGLLVSEGIIDEGWRGPLFAGVWNMGSEPVTVEQGQRIAQIIPDRVAADHLTPKSVDKLRPGARGENGFGSTGEHATIIRNPVGA